MLFECAKAENCFAESRTYEYRLPVTAGGFMALLDGWDVKENRKYRRPIFTASRNGVNIRCVLTGRVIRVSFPDSRWENEKAQFEYWLESLEGA